jgi:hypothetical protein
MTWIRFSRSRFTSHIAGLLVIPLIAAASLLQGAAPVISQGDAFSPGALAYQTTLQDRRLLVLRSADGRATRTISLPEEIDSVPAGAIAPNGRALVFYTGAVSLPNQSADDDLTLNVLRVPEGESVTVARLLPPDFPQNVQRNAELLIATRRWRILPSRSRYGLPSQMPCSTTMLGRRMGAILPLAARWMARRAISIFLTWNRRARYA